MLPRMCAGDANLTQLACWTRDWLDRIKNLYLAHAELTDAWNSSVAPAPGHAARTAATRLMQARAAGGHAIGAARDLRGAARHAAYAAGQAGAVAHVAAHELDAAAYAITAVRAAAPEGESDAAGRLECRWQRDQLPEAIRELVLDDQRLRNDICAHEDLPFIWWVTDHVMRHDRRAWWMRHWLLGTSCIQTLEVFGRREPTLLISHDADDGMWQLIGASHADGGTGKLGHLHHAVDEDPTLIDVLDLPPGRSAVRSGVGKPWTSQV